MCIHCISIQFSVLYSTHARLMWDTSLHEMNLGYEVTKIVYDNLKVRGSSKRDILGTGDLNLGVLQRSNSITC